MTFHTLSRRLPDAALWAAVLTGAVVGVVTMADLVLSDVPGDYVEGVLLAAQHDVAAARSLYDPGRWTEPPYSINLYGPVTAHLGAAMAAVAGPGLTPGRTLASAALGAALAALWWLGRRQLGLDRATATLAVLLPLGLPPLVVFATQYRVDVVAIAAGLWGLALGAESDRRRLLAPPLFVIAVFTKPTAVAAAAALALWLLLGRHHRRLAELVAGCLVLGGAWLSWLAVTTEGAFLTSVFGFNALPFALGGLARAAQQAFAGGVLALAAAVAVTTLARGADAGERLLALAQLAALALALATVGRVGANFNYFVEPCLLAGPVLAAAWQRARFSDELRPLATAAIAAVVGATLLWSVPRAADEWRGRRARVAVERQLAEHIASGDAVLTLEVASVLGLGAEPYLNDPSIFARLAEKELWDDARLTTDLERGAVAWVLADEDLRQANHGYSNWPPRVRSAVARSYRLTARIGDRYWLFQPHPGGVS